MRSHLGSAPQIASWAVYGSAGRGLQTGSGVAAARRSAGGTGRAVLELELELQLVQELVQELVLLVLVLRRSHGGQAFVFTDLHPTRQAPSRVMATAAVQRGRWMRRRTRPWRRRPVMRRPAGIGAAGARGRSRCFTLRVRVECAPDGPLQADAGGE